MAALPVAGEGGNGMTDVIGRRRVLTGLGAAGAGAVGLAALGPAGVASADDRGDRGAFNGVEGAWLVTHTNTPDQGTTLAVATFAAGGALASLDINPEGPPQLGAWAATSPHGFVGTFYSGSGPDQGPPPPGQSGPPPAYVRVDIRGSWHDDHISGSFSLTAFDASNNVVFTQGGGSFQGTRIHASNV